jgi:hypothetical protein
MEKWSQDKKDKIITILRDHLNLGEITEQTQPYLSSSLRYYPDLTIEDGNRLIIIELKYTARFEAVSQLFLYKTILKKEMVNRDIVAVLMAKAVNPEIERVAEEHDVTVIRLPPNISVSDRSPISIENKLQKTKVTSEKSWKVVCSLLRNKYYTIRQVSIKEKVSYGLAHLVIRNLQEKGIVENKMGFFEILDPKKLFNGIAWERPFERLHYEEFRTHYDNSYAAAKAISEYLVACGIEHAFTGLTAGSLYTGHGIRYDAAYLYLNKEDFDTLKATFYSDDANIEEKGVKIHIYSPDRDVFSNVQQLESVTVVSPSQALLDLAGLGYSGMDMTNALAEKYGRLIRV